MVLNISQSIIYVGQATTLILSGIEPGDNYQLFENDTPVADKTGVVNAASTTISYTITKTTPGLYIYYYEITSADGPITTNTITLTVIQPIINISISGISIVTKTYDGNKNATISGSPTLNGINAGDNVYITGITANFITEDVGFNKTVTLTSYILNGTDASKYNLIQPKLTGDIIKATPIITKLPLGSNIELGQSLTSLVLFGGSANVSGTFSFTNPLQKLKAGINIVNITFIPTDTTNYNNVTNNINIMVIENKIPTLSIPPLIPSINLDLNIYRLNPTIEFGKYRFYSSDKNIAEIDINGNIILKKNGKFYIIITNNNGVIIATSGLIQIEHITPV